jgi:hypothetical protein
VSIVFQGFNVRPKIIFSESAVYRTIPIDDEHGESEGFIVKQIHMERDKTGKTSEPYIPS